MVEIKNIKENNVVYTKNGVLQWKPIEKHRQKKQYPMMDMGKISVPDDYCVDQTVLERSRELYKQTKEMIPVCITFDKRLIGGFEQWEIVGSHKHGMELNYIRNYLNRKKQKGRDNC